MILKKAASRTRLRFVASFERLKRRLLGLSKYYAKNFLYFTGKISDYAQFNGMKVL